MLKIQKKWISYSSQFSNFRAKNDKIKPILVINNYHFIYILYSSQNYITKLNYITKFKINIIN